MNYMNLKSLDKIVTGKTKCLERCSYLTEYNNYCNVPKFLDRKVWANSVEPDQTAPREAV